MDFLTKPGFVEFTGDFDPVKHAHDLLSKPTEHSAQLQFNIDFIKKKIDEKVLDSHTILFEGVGELHSMDSIVRNTASHLQSLKQAYKQLQEKINIPFTTIQNTCLEITELNQQISKLRTVQKFLQVFGRLESIAQEVEEFPRAALYSYEIQSLLGDFEPIPLIEDELARAKEFHERLKSTGLQWIQQGIETNNQLLLAKAVTLFSNLQELPSVVSTLFNDYQSHLQKEAKEAFNMDAIKAQLVESRKLQTGQKQGNASALAEILWSRVEKLTDLVYKYASQLHILDGYLTRKKDNFTQISFVKDVVAEMGCTSIKSHYWFVLSQNLDKEIKTATKNNPVLLQILQFGYPKLLRVFVELFQKVDLQSGGADQAETTVLLKTLSSFENAYVSRTLTRMLDMVHSLIPEKGKAAGSEEANKLCRTISSELNAVRFDSHLLQAVGKNVTKALNLFRSRLLQTLGTIPFSITGSQPGTAQIQKIDAINCLFSLSDSLWEMTSEFSGTPAESILDEGAKSANDLMVTIVEPLFTSAINELDQVLQKMHREEYNGKNLINRTDPTSIYVSEYLGKLRWVFRELVSKLLCKHVTVEWAKQFCERMISLQLYHISLLSLSETGNLKVASDITQVEYLFSQSLSVLGLQDAAFLFLPFKDLKLLENIEPIVVINHVLIRSGVIPTPMALCNWSESDYVKWIDTHFSKDVRDLVRKCLDTYLGILEKEGKTETCLEHPVLRTLLLDWEALNE